jgi:predicted Rossmann-fold nucleotide-binding protein
MLTKADAIIAFPGGIGMFDELLEAAVEQYQRPYKGKKSISKPIVMANVEGHFNKFGELVDDLIDRGFVRPAVKNMFLSRNDAEGCVQLLKSLQGHPRMTLEEIGNCEGVTRFAATHRGAPAPVKK